MSTDLDPLLKRLALANARRIWRDLVRKAETEQWSYEHLLLTLFAEEIAHRRGTKLHRAVRGAGLPFLRTIDEFDFSYQSTLRLTTIGSMLSPDFVTEGHSAILHGKTGRGKTHLAIAIAYRAMQNGFDALFANCAELIDDLSAASRDGLLRSALARYVKPHVLVVDEVGYLTYGDDAANVLFHVVNERHIKKRAMLFTTNKHPKRWGPVLHDDDLAEAIVDRILERGRLIRMDGPSVRTKHLADDATMTDDHLDTDETADRRFSRIRTADFPEPTRDRAYTRADILGRHRLVQQVNPPHHDPQEHRRYLDGHAVTEFDEIENRPDWAAELFGLLGRFHIPHPADGSQAARTHRRQCVICNPHRVPPRRVGHVNESLIGNHGVPSA